MRKGEEAYKPVDEFGRAETMKITLEDSKTSSITGDREMKDNEGKEWIW